MRAATVPSMVAASEVLDLSASPRVLRGVGPVRARQLAEAGCATLRDLLLHLPRRYEDRRTVFPVAAARPGETASFRGKLERLQVVRVRRRRLPLVRARLVGDDGALTVVWFNQPYLAGRLEAEREHLLHGAVRSGRNGPELVNPSCEPLGEDAAGPRIHPVYPALGGLGPARMGKLLAQLVEGTDLASAVPEKLPPALLRRRGLPPVGEALAFLHRPPEDADLEALNQARTPHHRRLIYGELLRQQRRLARIRAERRRRPKEHSYELGPEVRDALSRVLPFTLTAAQSRALEEILADLASPAPMSRLLQGDVGCGKTAVAALALVAAAESRLQGAFMAPTELLAEQHFASLGRLLGRRCRLAVLTGSTRSASLNRRIRDGEVDVVVGTHALIQETVGFGRLGLVVIDEQHRFGVEQRRRLQRKGRRPDLLVMTATPIPRSLALTAYGDLDVSWIDALPPGRRPVETRVLPETSREEVYRQLDRRLGAGEQGFVVVPLIEESDRLEAASLEERGRRIREVLGRHSSALLHGRLVPEERQAVVGRFSRGELRLLVATTVIEVGVDVPGATLMVIESAERFGLAQLHQLRGRVGRGAAGGVCFALHGELGDTARKRLEIFATTRDGFAIAEQDLALRGPGDLLGTRQAGVPELRLADPARDRKLLLAARQDARSLLQGPSSGGAGKRT